MSLIKLSMVEGRQLVFEFTTYKKFIIFLQKNRICGEWKIELKIGKMI